MQEISESVWDIRIIADLIDKMIEMDDSYAQKIIGLI